MSGIEIKSSLINSDEFKFVKQSLIAASEKDGQDKFRVKTLEYINDSCENGDDMFFYDMLEFVRFLDPSDPDTKNHVAYTTPDCLIYFNMPCDHVKNARQWDFVHDHECLHQLWKTFGVAERIKNEGIEYNHMLLNVASDCVINQYLRDIRKKECSDGLVTPEYLEKTFGIAYDYKHDTQFSLYVKLLDASKEIQDVMDKLIQQFPEYNDDQEGQNGQQRQSGQQGQQSQSGQQGQQGQSGQQGQDGQQRQSGQQGQPGDQDGDQDGQQGSQSSQGSQGHGGQGGGDRNPNETASEAADRAEKAAESAENTAKSSGDPDDAANAKEARDAAKEAAKAAKDAASARSEKAKADATKKARAAADRAEDAASKAGAGTDRQDGAGEEVSNPGGSGHGSGESVKGTETDEDLDRIRKQASSIIEKYRQKVSGVFGEFISKCKSSLTLNQSGLKVSTEGRGAAGWAKKMKAYVNGFVKKKVFQKRREYELTYKRMNRRQGVVHPGDMIVKGKRVKKNGLTINAAFYIDRSGSMCGCLDDVFTAAYALCESIKKHFKADKIVEDVTFKMHAFDTKMVTLQYGKKIGDGGGTMSFDEILDYITLHTKDFMINVIITDADFNIDEGEVKRLIKDIDGMILFITNQDNDIMKGLAKQYSSQLFYILADPNFTI